MGTQVNIPSLDAIIYCGNEDPMSLFEVICGCPVTVDLYKNPFQKRPEDLSENTWYLVRSDQIRDSEAGFWMAKGEPCPMIFPNLPIICWEISRVFRERNDRETDWMMLEYSITMNNGTFSICGIWQDPNAQDTGILPESDVGFVDCPIQDTGILPESDVGFVDCPIQDTGILPESDVFSGGDFLELLDLEVPLFPSIV